MLALAALVLIVQSTDVDSRNLAAMAERKVIRRRDVKLADLTGDWDGDGKPDTAITVAKGKERGVLVVWGNGKPPVLLGVGKAFNKTLDHDFDSWEVAKRSKGAKRDAMVWTWSERASARIKWSGKRFVWVQEGD